MTGFASPDVPAYVSYLVVVVFGAFVARTRVSGLLEAYRDRWAFLGTWLVFLAYVAMPVALFWFLDYTGAINDTSIFAALVVAIGYQQVIAGSVSGITMPGQSTALWKPFEAWVRKVADRIETLNKRYLDQFDEEVRGIIAADPSRITALQQLVMDRAQDPAGLAQALALLRTDRQKVDVLWRNLRASEPEQYGLLARRAKLVSRWLYFRWQQKGQGRLMTAAVMGLVIVLGLSAWSRVDEPGVWHAYYKWRLFKSNSTDRDRFRTREYFVRLLRDSEPSAPAVLTLLIPELSYSALPTHHADDLLRLMIDCHSPALDRVTLNLLVEALRTTNPDVRIRVHATMVYLASASFPDKTLEDSLRSWAPTKDDSPALIDARVTAWRKWLAI